MRDAISSSIKEGDDSSSELALGCDTTPALPAEFHPHMALYRLVIDAEGALWLVMA